MLLRRVPLRDLGRVGARLRRQRQLVAAVQVEQDERGRAAYACSAGETSFWRRQPHQLSSTLAFMLGREGSRAGRSQKKLPTA